MSLISAFDCIRFQRRRASSVEDSAVTGSGASTSMGKNIPFPEGEHLQDTLHGIVTNRSIKHIANQTGLTEDAIKKWRLYGVPALLVRLFRWMVSDDVVWAEAVQLRSQMDADALTASIAQKRAELDRLEHQRQGMMDAANSGRRDVMGLPSISGKVGRTV